MIMTEADAKQCRCVGPQQCGKEVVIGGEEVRIGDDIMLGVRTKRLCIGSKCLAWRWMCTATTLIYEDGDGMEQLPEYEWLGTCGVIDPLTKPYTKSKSMLPKRSV